MAKGQSWAVVGTSSKKKVVVGLTNTQAQAEVWAANLRGLADDADASWLRYGVYHASQLDALKLGAL